MSLINYYKILTNTKQVSYVTSKNWDGNLLDSTDIMSIGNIMYTSYSIWLLITSIILLLAMVGSIVITIKQKINKLCFIIIIKRDFSLIGKTCDF